MASVYCCRLLDLGLSFAYALPCDPARVYALTAGGVEVADALAYFVRSPVRWLGPEELTDAAPDPGIRGQLTYLVDDGGLPDESLLATGALLRSAGPKRLVLVVPFARASFRRKALAWFDEIHVDLDHVPRRRLFSEQADDEFSRGLVERSRGYPSMPLDPEEQIEFVPEG
jgi:hypothetical protein